MSALEDRLARLQAPRAEESKDRAQQALAKAAADGRLRRSVPLKAQLAAVAAVVLLGLTPPGQALAERFGELVGIGDEPTEGGIGQSVVTGLVEINGVRYEVVASNTTDEVTFGDVDQPCIGLEIPGVPGPAAYSCVTSEFQNELLPVVYGAPRELAQDAELITQGLAPAGTEAVEIEYRTLDEHVHQTTAQVSALTEELAAEIRATEGTRFFVAFLPEGILLPPDRPDGALTEANAKQALDRIVVVAYDGEGRELERTRIGDLGHKDVLASNLKNIAPAARFGPSGMQERAADE